MNRMVTGSSWRWRARSALAITAVTFLISACGSNLGSVPAAGDATAVPSTAAPSASAGDPSADPGSTPTPAPSSSPTTLPTPTGIGLPYPPVGPLQIGAVSAHGKVIRLTMAAPWRSGRYTLANVAVYLPPGFDPTGATRYPVIYEVPYTPSTWTQFGRFNLPLALDDLIARRLIAPEIVVFLGTSGGPYIDSECADSFDHRAWIETWIVNTVVPWVDRKYPTVASRLGRAVMGSSQGGYCAAALWSHHPDVFGAAIAESGYFVSGIRSSQTPRAWKPFGGNAAYEAQQSPINAVTKISPALRAASLVLLEADPSNWFYGRQAAAFMPVLAHEGIPYRLYADPGGHSWPAFRRETPRMLVDLAKWMAWMGVP